MGVAQISSAITPAQPVDQYPGDIKSVLLTAEQIQARIGELGEQIGSDYRDVAAQTGQDLLLITVLKGAVIFVTDLARAIPVPTQFEFMAVSSYGSSTSSSGVVRILKDLDRDIEGRDVLIVEDVVDSGLTLSWLLRNLRSRGPAWKAVAMARAEFRRRVRPLREWLPMTLESPRRPRPLKERER